MLAAVAAWRAATLLPEPSFVETAETVTLTAFVLCSVRVATLIEYTVTDGELRLSHHVFGP